VPTIITHPVIALLKAWFPRVPPRALGLGAVATVLPDADVVAFALDIPYEDMLGHRGISHSIAFAFVVALLGSLLVKGAFAFLFLCALSHPLLDALTDGGLGVALFAPFSNERYFFPWTPIRVSPIGAGFFSTRGMQTLVSEVVWVWVPVGALTLVGKYVAQRHRETRQQR
jgi:inner membrane protein